MLCQHRYRIAIVPYIAEMRRSYWAGKNSSPRRSGVNEMALFGSLLRGDFSSHSDVDILISFTPEVTWSLFDLVAMKSELEAIFGREVDLIEKEAMRNPFRRRSIFGEMQKIYEIR